jgi:hypothetical protein
VTTRVLASPDTLVVVLRVLGASHLALALAHVALWRLFGWSSEIERLSPLTARVFAAHTFFVAFVLAALGALALARPDLLVAPSELARLLLGAIVAFWLLRLLAQPFLFDRVLLLGSRHRTLVRGAATLLFAIYVAAYGWAFARQLG